MVRKRKIGVQGYIFTSFIVGLAIITYCHPVLSSLFIYDRQAILNGELWRLLTSPLVHFSNSHFFWNILSFSIAGVAVSTFKYPCFWIVCGISTSVSGLVFLLAIPDMAFYGGLSGLVTGAVAYFCLYSIFETGKKRGIWLIILILMLIKIIVEVAFGEPIFAKIEKVPFRVLPAAHIVGYLSAIVTIIWTCAVKSLRAERELK